MIHLIEPSNYQHYRQELTGMYRLRHEIFYNKLQWEVKSEDGLEKDEYDEKNAYYLVYKDQEGKIKACMRLIEMKNECMFDGPFSFFRPYLESFKRAGMWEISRLAIDPLLGPKRYMITCKMLAALYHFGFKVRKVELFCSINYPSIIKLYQRYGLWSCKIAEKKREKESLIVSGYVPLKLTYENLLKLSGHQSSQNLSGKRLG